MAVLTQWIEHIPEDVRPYVIASAGLGLAAILGYAVAWVLLLVLRRISTRSRNPALGIFESQWRAPVRFIVPLFFINFAGVTSSLPEPMREPLLRLVNLLIIAGVAAFAIRSVRATREFVGLRFDVAVRDNLRARTVHTQVRVFEKVLSIVIVVIAAALMLMTFERIRHLGLSIFASAGIVGIVIGLAAQKTIGTFIAGLQIAITQPIRLDDVVIVEGEWGVIEEITLTYVVVRIWDLRRLILPVTYFIEKPFQNWTRVSADILGTIFLYVDYRIPLDRLRSELRRICESSELWDTKVCQLVVTEAREHNLQLRALISAPDSGQAWDLRCLVREKLIEFIQREYPESFPRFRAELGTARGVAGESGHSPMSEEGVMESDQPATGHGGVS